jgi:hypothetical protein
MRFVSRFRLVTGIGRLSDYARMRKILCLDD